MTGRPPPLRLGVGPWLHAFNTAPPPRWQPCMCSPAAAVVLPEPQYLPDAGTTYRATRIPAAGQVRVHAR